MRAFILADGTLRETQQADEIRAAAQAQRPLWLDLHEQSPEADRLLAETFGLHPLAIEDIWGHETVPKIENYDQYLYVLVDGVKWTPGTPRITRIELDVVIGKTFVISHHSVPMATIDGVVDDLKRNPKLLEKGSAWVAHSLFDHLLDHYSPVMDTFDAHLEDLEAEVIAKAGLPEGRELLPRLFDLKRSLQDLRRVTMYQREILLRLARGEFECLPRDVLPFYRDVYDQFARFAETSEGYRDLVSSALEAYLSVQGNRMNEVMKTLTLMSTVMLPLTFIAGVYGMNFKYMPELEWQHGYPFAIGLMLAVAVGILFVFWRKRWI